MPKRSMPQATMTKGICNFCKTEVEKNKMTQHLKFCKQRAATLKTSAEDANVPPEKLFHIVMEGKYNPQYWMHLEVPASEPLGTLDDFIRDIWVECCDHLSAFEINGTNYQDEPPAFDFSSFVVLGAENTENGSQAEVQEEEEEEEEEDLSPEELAQAVGEYIDAYVTNLRYPFSAELREEFRKPRSRDEMVAFLKEKIRAIPKISYAVTRGWTQEDWERERVLDAQKRLLETILDEVEDRSLGVPLEKVLKVGQKFSYEYDFGSTTYISLRVAAEREGTVKADDPITILARNIPPVIPCVQCGQPATKVVMGYYDIEENAYCDACAKKRITEGEKPENTEEEEDEDGWYEVGEEGFLPIVNSPRVGVCGYTGDAEFTEIEIDEDEDEDDENSDTDTDI